MTTRGVTWAGVAVNVTLSVLKVGVGLLARSQTLLADGLHSISDLVTDVAVLAGLRISSRPADEDHHYGHARVTTLVTMFVGSALLVTAVWIVYSAIATFQEPHSYPSGALPFWVAVASILPKELLYRVTRRVGMAAHDASVVANAWHHRTDAFTSVAAAAGLAGVAFGGPRWGFLDHLTAVVLSAFLAMAAFRFIRESVSELIDGAPGGKVVGCLEEAISGTPGVHEFHNLRVRKVAGSLMLDVQIHVAPDLSVVDGHDIATEVRRRLIGCGCDVVEAMVHVEPDLHTES
ncbi:MAG: cation transporter [Candidatus Eisenbacteria bacterium]|nr:cation transporter [Candidatus Eisenbacteria bacterium]